MACRDCKWWDLTTLQADCGRVVAYCGFDEEPVMSAIPYCIDMAARKVKMAATDGEGCPQFKERNDGE